eukprot:m.200876 g.200876  ORF g.200876 m.200876 type:complete len:931 (+) comp10101_c1_seq1:22-2814(+)
MLGHVPWLFLSGSRICSADLRGAVDGQEPGAQTLIEFSPETFNVSRAAFPATGLAWVVDTRGFVFAEIGDAEPFQVEEECFEIMDGQRELRDETGTALPDRAAIMLPSHRWNWIGDWGSAMMSYGTERDFLQPVAHKARRWVRTRECTHAVGRRWTRVIPAFGAGNEGVADIACAEDSTIWIITDKNKVFFRVGLSLSEPEGRRWVPAPPLPAALVADAEEVRPCISVSPDGKSVWAVTSSGLVYFLLSGVHTQWTHMPGPVRRVASGAAGVWAITEDDEIVVRIGVLSERREGCGWALVSSPVPDRALVACVTCLSAEEMLFVDTAGEVHCRAGISPTHEAGAAWDRLPLLEGTIVRWIVCPPGPSLAVPAAPLLHQAVMQCRVHEVEQLLAGGDDVNATDIQGRTPLHIAVMRSALDCLATLLGSRDIDINARDVNSMTALHVACLSTAARAAEMLVNNEADLFLRDEHGNTCLHLAAWAAGNGPGAAMAICQKFIDHTPSLVFAHNKAQRTAGWIADHKGHADIKTLLFEAAIIHNAAPDFRSRHRGEARIFSDTRLGLRGVPGISPGLEVYATLEGGRMSLYNVSNYSDKLTSAALWRLPDTRIRPRGDSVDLFFGNAWQLTIKADRSSLARWTQGLLAETSPLLPIAYTADPSVLTVTAMAKTWYGGLGEGTYAGRPVTIKLHKDLYSQATTWNWDPAIALCGPVSHVLLPFAFGQTKDVRALQHYDGGVYTVGPTLGGALPLETVRPANCMTLASAAETVELADWETLVCYTRQFCLGAYHLAVLGVQFSYVITPSCVVVREGEVLIHNCHALATSEYTSGKGETFFGYARTLLQAWTHDAPRDPGLVHLEALYAALDALPDDGGHPTSRIAAVYLTLASHNCPRCSTTTDPADPPSLPSRIILSPGDFPATPVSPAPRTFLAV